MDAGCLRNPHFQGLRPVRPHRMTRSDNPTPNADTDRLVDLVLGELPPAEAEALEARVADETIPLAVPA